MDSDAVCLFCLGPHESINVLSYLDGKTKLSWVLGQISGFLYPSDVQLPSNVCEPCFDRARDIFNFQTMAKSSLEKIARSLPITAQRQPVICPPAAVEKPKPAIGEPKITESQKEKTEEIDQKKDVEEEEESDYEEYVLDAEGVNYAVVIEDEDPMDDLMKFNIKKSSVSPPKPSSPKKRSLAAAEPRPKRSRNSRSSSLPLSPPLPARNFGCHQCKLYFETHKKLVLHNRDVHEKEPGESESKIYYCMKCMRKFEAAESLKSHESECLGDSAIQKPFSCGICLKRFTYQTEVKNHQREEHDSKKQFPCPVCSQKFTRKSQVTIHMRGHTNERPFECTVCKAAFSKRTNMVRHMTKHNEDSLATYCCSLCDKTFRWETSLKVHLNTHSKIRLFKCEHCVKDYSSISGLRKHALAHHFKE